MLIVRADTVGGIKLLPHKKRCFIKDRLMIGNIAVACKGVQTRVRHKPLPRAPLRDVPVEDLRTGTCLLPDPLRFFAHMREHLRVIEEIPAIQK